MNDEFEYKKVAEVAYYLWQERGYPIGSPEEDWFLAETQVQRDHSMEPNNDKSIAKTQTIRKIPRPLAKRVATVKR